MWRIKAGDTTPPVPVHITLRSIIDAFDDRLWATLPESGATYANQQVAAKRANLERALRKYPAVRNARSASGIN